MFCVYKESKRILERPGKSMISGLTLEEDGVMEIRTSEGHIEVFDALKGVAILGVLLIHSGNNVPGELSAIQEAIISNGKKGVQIFFIISAILVYKSLSNFYGSQGKGKHCVLAWYKKRFLRLIPLYWLTNLAILLYAGMKPTYASGTHGVTIFTYITNFLFLHGFYPWHINAISINWYIGTLAIFILIAPAFFAVINTIWRAGILFAFSIILQKIVSLTIATWDFGADTYVWRDYWEGFSIFEQLPVLSVGIILYFVLFRYETHLHIKNYFVRKVGQHNAKKIFYLCFIFFGVLIMSEIVSYANIYIFSVTIAFVIILLFCLPIRIISNKIFVFIGKYSYGIYLFHPLILGRINIFISKYMGNTFYNIILSALIALCICLIASVILTKYYEKNIIKLLDR